MQEISNIRQFSYKSPDGDEYVITFTSSPDRQYIQWVKQGETSPVTVDWKMLQEIYEELVPKPTKTANHKGLKVPNVVDLRTRPTEQAVKESLLNQDDTLQPVQSFTPGRGDFDWDKERAGLDPSVAMTPAGETPADIKDEEENIKRDVAERMTRKGVGGRTVKNDRVKVRPEDII